MQGSWVEFSASGGSYPAYFGRQQNLKGLRLEIEFETIKGGFWPPFSELAVRTGLEPVTPCVTGMYSNQAELTHQTLFQRSGW